MDDFDPSFLFLPSTDNRRIYGDDRAEVWCEVSEEDYHWAIKWRWHVNHPHAKRNGQKKYFCRQQSNGKRYMPKLYLHIEIMKRTGIEPPSPEHKLVDHIDGNEWNNRRDNLEWATVIMNRRNIKNVGASLRY